MLSIFPAYPRTPIKPLRSLPHFSGNKDKDYSHLRKATERANLYGAEEYRYSRKASDPHLAEILRRFLKKNDTILEIGCNTGNNLLPLGKRYKAYGVDLDRGFVRQLNESAARKRLGRRVCAEQWDMAEDGSQPPKWPDLRGKCGAIYAVHVLSHFSDDALRDLVTKLKPYLKPGGVFVATIINPSKHRDPLSKYQEIHRVLIGFHSHPPDVVDQAFEGFELVRDYSRPFKPGELTGWCLPEDRLRWVVYQLPGFEPKSSEARFSFSAFMAEMRSRLGCWMNRSES